MPTLKIHLVQQDPDDFTTAGYITLETSDIKQTAMTINRVLASPYIPGRIKQFTANRNEFALCGLPEFLSIEPYNIPETTDLLVELIKANLPEGMIRSYNIHILEADNPNIIYHGDEPSPGLKAKVESDTNRWVFPPSAPSFASSLFTGAAEEKVAALAESKTYIDELEEKGTVIIGAGLDLRRH